MTFPVVKTSFNVVVFIVWVKNTLKIEKKSVCVTLRAFLIRMDGFRCNIIMLVGLSAECL